MTRHDLFTKREALQEEYSRRAQDANWALTKEATKMAEEISEISKELKDWRHYC